MPSINGETLKAVDSGGLLIIDETKLRDMYDITGIIPKCMTMDISNVSKYDGYSTFDVHVWGWKVTRNFATDFAANPTIALERWLTPHYMYVYSDSNELNRYVKEIVGPMHRPTADDIIEEQEAPNILIDEIATTDTNYFQLNDNLREYLTVTNVQA